MATIISGGCKILKPLKFYKKLQTSKGRQNEGFFIVEGPRSINQFLQNDISSVKEILVLDGCDFSFENNIEKRTVTRSQFTELSTDKTSQGVLAIVKIPDFYYSDNIPFDAGSGILLLEDVQDPGNVGTLIRTAAAFGFSGVILSDKCADAYSPKATHAASGSQASLWIRKTKNYMLLLDSLKSSGYFVVATDLKGDTTSKFAKEKKIIMVIGNEGNGISSGMAGAADYLSSIEKTSTKILNNSKGYCRKKIL